MGRNLSVRQYRELFELNPYPMWVFDMETLRFLEANEACGRFFGYPRRELLRLTLAEVRPAEEMPRMRRLLKLSDATFREEQLAVYLRKDGSRFYGSVTRRTARFQGRKVALVVGRNLESGEKAQRALKEAEERFRLLVSSVRDYAVFMLDPDGRVATWNEGAQRIKGYRPEQIIGRHCRTFYSPADRRRKVPEKLLAAAASCGEAKATGWRLRRDGRRFLAEVVVTAIRDHRGALRGFAKVTRDVTEREAARARVELSARQLDAAETERKRVARELHDGVNQLLATSLLRLRAAEDLLGAGRQGGVSALVEGRRILQESIGEIRRISADLRPAVLDDLGLCAAVRSAGARAAAESGVPVSVSTFRQPRGLDPAVELAAFRIVQEGLHNALRHGRPRRVSVRLKLKKRLMTVEIADDGRGFSLRRRPRPGAMGLESMSDRARLLGGAFAVKSAPGKGAVVRVEFPV